MLLNLVQAVDRADVAVAVACVEPGPFVEELRAVEDLTVIDAGPPARLLDPRGGALRVARRLEGVTRQYRPDVVDCFGEKMAALGGFAARRAGVPAVARLHDAPAAWRDTGTRLVQAAALRACTDVAVPAEWLAETFRRRTRRPVTVVPNGVSLGAIPDQRRGRRRLLGATGFDDADVVFGIVGRLERWKGVDVGIDAFARLAGTPAGARARLAVIGGALYGRDEAYAAGLRQQAAVAGLDGRAWFGGHRDDALELIAGCDVVVHCAVEPEPFGMVVAEAMAAGRAVVATRSRGPEEIVRDGVDGVLVPPGDPAALAVAMRSLLDADRRARLGAAAVDAAARFDVDRVVASNLGLWHAAAARRPNPS